MSNGTTCCAAEICCDASAARARVRSALMARGLEPKHCDEVCQFMDHEGLMFAPESLRPFVQDLVAMARKHEATQAHEK